MKKHGSEFVFQHVSVADVLWTVVFCMCCFLSGSCMFVNGFTFYLSRCSFSPMQHFRMIAMLLEWNVPPMIFGISFAALRCARKADINFVNSIVVKKCTF